MSTKSAADKRISFELNSNRISVNVESNTRLSDVLRHQLDQNDVKIGCNAGDCGACSVLLNNKCVCACLTPVEQADDARIDTVRGLTTSDPVTKHLTDAFLHFGAAQCGICTPGMLVSATALLRVNPNPSEQQVADQSPRPGVFFLCFKRCYIRTFRWLLCIEQRQ